MRVIQFIRWAPLTVAFLATTALGQTPSKPELKHPDVDWKQFFDPAPPKGESKRERFAGGIGAAGHGLLFSDEMQPIKAEPEALSPILDKMLELVRNENEPKFDKEGAAAVKDAEQTLAARKLTADEALLLKGALLHQYLLGSTEKVRLRFEWRASALLSAFLAKRYEFVRQLPAWLVELIKRLHLFDPIRDSTSYMRDCKAHDVPVPPDWAQSGTAWVYQGNLSRNLLDPGGRAEVWTYSDPARRGACIALPRGTGAPGSVAGIICQSAKTGHACFWDNKLRSVSPEQFMGWAGLTLKIADLKDGSNLASSCTGCHRGNNVFLISPDDPTWAKLLRGPLSGPVTGTFTIRVESSADMSLGYPRYVPITTLPPRAGWENPPPTAAGCSGSCHEPPSPLLPSNPPMPPACASAPGGCYGW